MIESHRLPNGGILHLQIAPDDMLQEPSKGCKRAIKGEGWVVDIEPLAPFVPVKKAVASEEVKKNG